MPNIFNVGGYKDTPYIDKIKAAENPPSYKDFLDDDASKLIPNTEIKYGQQMGSGRIISNWLEAKSRTDIIVINCSDTYITSTISKLEIFKRDALRLKNLIESGKAFEDLLDFYKRFFDHGIDLCRPFTLSKSNEAFEQHTAAQTVDSCALRTLFTVCNKNIPFQGETLEAKFLREFHAWLAQHYSKSIFDLYLKHIQNPGITNLQNGYKILFDNSKKVEYKDFVSAAKQKLSDITPLIKDPVSINSNEKFLSGLSIEELLAPDKH